jgi:hypothetical protein
MSHFQIIAGCAGIVAYAVLCVVVVLKAGAARRRSWESFERAARRYCAGKKQ